MFTHSPRRDSWQPERITAFNAKRLAEKYLGVATSLEEEDARLRGLLGEMGALDAAARKEQIEQLSKDATALAQEVERERAELSSIQALILVNRDRLALEEVGLFDFEHPAEGSASLATSLEAVRSEIRQLNKIGSAITASQSFTFNNSASKG